MSHVLGAAPHGPRGDAVRVVASAAAHLLDGGRPMVTFTRSDSAEEFLAGMRDPDVSVGVVPRAGLGGVAWPDLVRAGTRPTIVVPDGLRDLPAAVTRVLVPLDGTAEAAHAVGETAGLCAKAGVDLIVLHVFDPETVPRHWDQAAHAWRDWQDEFLARYCPLPGVRLHLRSGVAGDHVVGVADAEQVDLIVLGWSRSCGPGRARTVRRTVADAAVPVMLLPIVLPTGEVRPLSARPPSAVVES